MARPTYQNPAFANDLPPEEWADRTEQLLEELIYMLQQSGTVPNSSFAMTDTVTGVVYDITVANGKFTKIARP